jgi:hypothetical protein
MCENGICQVARGVLHYGLAISNKKYLKAKEIFWELKYFNVQKYNLQKILEKKQKPFRYYNSN